MQTKTTHASAAAEVVRWRSDQLLAAGFDRRLACKTAENAGYDLHALIELVERGCPPELAVRILAPLEGESPA